jgi:hypothetical protein
VNGLQQNVPSRIDRSYWDPMFSGSTGTQLVAALRFLGLIDGNNHPSPRLRSLASSALEKRPLVLREIAAEAYQFVLKSPALEPDNATYAQLQEVFKATFPVADDVSRKCIKFFIAMAGDAGIPLSPHILKRSRSVHGTGGIRNVVKKSGMRTNRNPEVLNTMVEMPDRTSWNKMLLEKFPTFDPSWSDEIKLKWFAAFDELLSRSYQEKK